MRSRRSKRKKDAAILLRQAACYERQSDEASAEIIYRNAIRAASNPNHQILAIIGFTRVLANRKRLDEAVNLITEQSFKWTKIVRYRWKPGGHLVFEYAKILEKKALEFKNAREPKQQSASFSDDLTDSGSLCSRQQPANSGNITGND